MKKIVSYALCSVLSVIMLAACGDGNSSKSHGKSESSSGGFAADVSEIVADCSSSSTAAEEKIKGCKDMDEAIKLGKKLQELQEKSEAKIEAAAKELVGKKISYQTSDGLFYTIASDPVITKAFANGNKAVSMDIAFRAAQKDTLEIPKLSTLDYPICYKFVDTKDAPIITGLTFPVPQNAQPVKLDAGQDYGQDLVITFSISDKNVDKRKDVAKIVFISKDDYETVTQQLKASDK